MGPTQEIEKISYLYFHYIAHRAEYHVSLFGILAILFSTLLVAWIIEQWTPSNKLRPTTQRGAAFIVFQALLYMSLTISYSYHSLSNGYIRCFSRRRYSCGVNLLDANGKFHHSYEHLVSLPLTPIAFWFSFFCVSCITLLLAYWLFGAMRWLIDQHTGANHSPKRTREKKRAA